MRPMRSIQLKQPLDKGLKDKDMWTYVLQQDFHMISEFGVGIVGIGALFFAYIEAGNNFARLQPIVALIGFAGSFILFLHIVETGLDFWNFKHTLAKRNTDFFKRFDDSRGWRGKWYGHLFHFFPITLLMAYFMLMVAFAWIVLLLGLTPGMVQISLGLIFVLIIFAIFLAFLRKDDLKE
jgi:hypothetical protein